MSSEDLSSMREDRGNGRNESPSLTGRMRSLNTRPVLRSHESATSRTQSTDSRREATDDGDESSSAGINMRQTPSQPEPEFRDEAVRSLQSSQPLASRISSLHQISSQIASYSPSTTIDVLDAIQELAQPESSSKARNAVLVFIESAAAIPELSDAETRRLFDLAIQPVPSLETSAQMKAIMAITKDGAFARPYQCELGHFFSETIRSQYAALSDARRKAKGSVERSRSQLPEEKGLHQLMSFIASTLKAGSVQIEGEDLIGVVQGTVYIAEKTTSKVDMRKAVELLQTIIRYSSLPPNELKPCVEIFCAIANAIPELNQLTWECLMLLLHLHTQGQTIQILLDTLALAPTDRHSHTVCGALGVLAQLVSHQRDPQLPKVEFARFIDSLWEVHFASRRIRRDCLKTIRSLLSESQLTNEILQSGWDHMVQIILTATGDETYIHDRTSEPLNIRIPGTTKDLKGNEQTESNADVALADDILQELKQVAEIFNSLWHRLSPEQRQLVGLYYYKLRLILPTELLRDLLNKLSDEGYFQPGGSNWQSHQLEMIRLFIWDREMDSSLGCQLIQILGTAASHAGPSELEHFHMLILRLLNGFQNEITTRVANELAMFARTVWKARVPSNLAEDLDRFWHLLHIDRVSSVPPEAEAKDAPRNQVAMAFVNLFLDYFKDHPDRASTVFDFLVKIAKSQDLPAGGRVQSLQLLSRIRCDEKGRVMLVDEPDTLGLAANLLRTDSMPSHSPTPHGALEGEDSHSTRTTRGSTMSQSSQGTLRGSLRVPSSMDRHSRIAPTRPEWMDDDLSTLATQSISEPSRSLFAVAGANGASASLRLSELLIAIIDILQQGGSWEVYSYVLVHIPSQLCNPSLFSESIPHIKMLRSVVGSQLQDDKFQEAPSESGVKKGDIALCLYSTLTMLLAYSEHFARPEQDDLVRAFITGISGWDRTPKACIQSLAIACYQVPAAVGRLLQSILFKMSQIITQSQLSVDILEFLGGLARLPTLYANFREEDYRLVFAICVRYLEHARDQRLKIPGSTLSTDYSSNRVSGFSARSAPSSDSGQHHLDVQKDLPQYVFALTHHVITVWFLSLRLTDRVDHVGWLTSKLVFMDQHQNEIMEEQSQVTLDMMHRTAYLDLGETVPIMSFSPEDGKVLKSTWIVGMSIVTIETAVVTGLTQLTKRQASGTTYASYQQRTAPLPPHHAPAPSEVHGHHGQEQQAQIFPNHVLLQLMSTIAPTPTPMEPISLPDDEITQRAITFFDRNDTVDGYKVGVIYVGPDQKDEGEILANTRGSYAYEMFLEGLGTKVRLKDAKFNTQGLDRRDDTDGLHTYAWRDRITELVFHVTTMMPTDLVADPLCVNKKRHIGNDFVKVIFNESGLPFRFDTFSSQFNYVNIIITPEAGCKGDIPSGDTTENMRLEKPSYYTIHTVTDAQLPEISPAASFKLLSLSNLPALVRHIALHSAIFSNVWVQREGGETITSWRNRLREIAKLRERFANTGTSTSMKFPGAKGTKTYNPGDSFHGRVGMGGIMEEEGLITSLDFSRWASPNNPTN